MSKAQKLPALAKAPLAANLLKAELKWKGVTYSQLVEKLNAMGVDEKEVNVRNKLSRANSGQRFYLNV